MLFIMIGKNKNIEARRCLNHRDIEYISFTEYCHLPLDQRSAEALGNLEREHGLAGPGLAFDQQRTLERDGGIDRDLEVVGCDIGAGSFKTHRLSRVEQYRRKRAHFNRMAAA